MSMIVTRGFGVRQLIILRGFGLEVKLAYPIVLPPDWLYRRRYPSDIDLRQELLDFLTTGYTGELDLRAELLEFFIEDINDISLRDELIEFFTIKSAMPELDLRVELKEFYEDVGQFEIDLRKELGELMNREKFEISLRKELQEFLT